MEFKKVELNDANILNEYFQIYNNGYNNSTLGGFFGWRKLLNTEYVIINDTLIQKIELKNGDIRFCNPIGKNPYEAIKWIANYASAKNIRILFFPISHDELEIFDKCFLYDLKHYDRTGDYIYDANALKTMAGRKLHGQKNHLNYFMKNYASCEITDISESNVEEIKLFIQSIKNNEKEQNSYMYKAEIEYDNEVLDNMTIYKYKGIVVKYNSKIIGLILGEEIKDTVYFHIMKLDKEYRGVAQYLIVNFLKQCSENVKYVNMEDDADDEDLKYTKTCYHPIKMQDVNLLIVKEVK